MRGERRKVLRGVQFIESEASVSVWGLRVSANILHASRTAPFLAVVKVEAFALEDEGTYAILRGGVSTLTCSNSSDLTWAVDVVRRAATGIF